MRIPIAYFLAITVIPLAVVGCSFDSFRSSALPEKMPDEVEFGYSENGGMAPIWKRLKIENDELVVEDKNMDERRPVFKYSVLSSDEQAKLYKIFRVNKFDLIENYKPDDITYDAGGDSISIRAGGQSYSASSGDNSPMSTPHSERYNKIERAFKQLVRSKESELKIFARNAVFVDYEPRKHRDFPKGAKQIDLGFENAARAVAAAKEALKNAGKEDLVSSGKYSIELIPFSKDRNISVFISGLCENMPGDRLANTKQQPGQSVCSFTLIADPRDASFKDFKFLPG